MNSDAKQARQRRCPTCGAMPYKPCVALIGKTEMKTMHSRRFRHTGKFLWHGVDKPTRRKDTT